MEILVILLLIAILVIALNLKNKIQRISFQVDRLTEELNKVVSSSTQSFTKEKPIDSRDLISQLSKPTVAKEETEKVAELKPTPEEKEQLVSESKARTISSMPNSSSLLKKPKPLKAPKVKKPSFMERNPDLEKFIGENLLSKIGIVIFVIGMGFLVKLGIDNNVITEVMRVAIGILIGGGMIGLAHYLRNSFAQFSAILIGGALAVLYFTIALSFHQYALISQTAAFIIMVLITSFGVLLSISYDRKTLAVLALIGGFGTPFFVSTGAGNYITLLSYILILDIGMLTLVYLKKWNIINYLAYGFTYILFSGVFVREYVGNEEVAIGPLFLFLTAFFMVFFFMSIIYNIKNKIKFRFAEVGMLLSNSAAYFGFGLALTQGYKEGLYSGLFTGLIAVFNFAFAAVLYKRKDVDKNILYLLLGLVLTFLTLVACIQLEGNYITLFWAIESVLLLWLSNKFRIKNMRLVSFIITLLMLVSLIMDWEQSYFNYYGDSELPVFLNKVFITSFVSMASVFALLKMFKEEEAFEFKSISVTVKPLYLKVVFALLVYGGLFLELDYQFIRFEFKDTLRIILLGIFNYTFVLAIIIRQRFKPSDLLQKLTIGLSVLVIISYMTSYLNQVSRARDGFLNNLEYSAFGFYVHYVLLVLFILILINLYQMIQHIIGFKSKNGALTLWGLAFIAIFISSAEAGHLSIIYQKSQGMSGGVLYENAVKYVYPIVWAITALGLMISGMKFRLKTLRITSLVVFGITTLKLFLYDLQGNSTGKIISFILLGVILLLISFLYQKLKFIIKDD